MSISTYNELKTAVENWIDRSDLTARIPEFISLAETRINRLLRSRSVEERAYTNTVSGQEYYSLPTDFLEARNIQLNTNPVTRLLYRTPQQMDREYPAATIGQPQVFTLVGNELQLKPIPDSGYELEIAYFLKLDPLSDTNLTNWIITNAPDLLLYGSLIEAEAFLVNDPRVPLWKTAFDEAMAILNSQEKGGRYSGSHLEIRTGTGNP